MDSYYLVIILIFIGGLIGAYRGHQWRKNLPYATEEQRDRWKYMTVLANLGAVPLSGYICWIFYKILLQMRAFERSYGVTSDSLESMASVILTLILLWLAMIGFLIWTMLRTLKWIDESRPSAKKDGECAP